MDRLKHTHQRQTVQRVVSLRLFSLLVVWTAAFPLSNAQANGTGLCHAYPSGIALNLTHSNPRIADLDPGLSLTNATRIRAAVQAYLRQTVDQSKFVDTRGVGAYANSFAWTAKIGSTEIDSLAKTFSRLNSRSHVIDLGAGQVRFLLGLLDPDSYPAIRAEATPSSMEGAVLVDTVSKHGVPNLTAITLNDLSSRGHVDGETQRRLAKVKHNPKANILAGRSFEEIPLLEILNEFGLADAVIDYFGVLTYTVNLPIVIEKLATVLKADGDLWFIADTSYINVNGHQKTVPEFLIETGLFEAVSGEYRPASEFPLVRAHLRRTSKPAYASSLYLAGFYFDANGGPPEISWKLIPPK